jgi:hypothetical protein
MSFCFLLFEDTFTSVFNDKKPKKVIKISEIKVYLAFLLVDGRIRIREAQKDTDPQQRCKQ